MTQSMSRVAHCIDNGPMEGFWGILKRERYYGRRFTGKDGTVKSRIVPTLTPGSICTDPRSCTHYIVTEYGMVNLKGLSTWERAEALISVAHPDFREQLIADAEKMHIWRRSNK